MAKKLAKIDKKQEEFLRKVWPGKVTAVLNKKKIKISGVGRRIIGLRTLNYKLINQLLLIITRPLTATSANIFGKPASTKI